MIVSEFEQIIEQIILKNYRSGLTIEIIVIIVIIY